MLRSCSSAVIFALCIGLFRAGGIDLRKSRLDKIFRSRNQRSIYILKCSLSDPKLGDCLKENANKAIPIIAKGDPQLGISKLSPFELKEGPILAHSLIIILRDVFTDDIKDIRVTEASIDLKRRKVAFKAIMNRVEVLAANYSIPRGEIIDIPVFGHGKFNTTMVNITFDYATDIGTYKKGGEEYIEFVNSTTSSDIERGYYYFENLTSPETDDANAYIEKNWKKFTEQLKPTTNTYLTTFMYQPLAAILRRVPLNKMFLP